MTVLAALALVLVLGACGVKSSPAFPVDGNYPRQYPPPGPKIQTSAPAPSTAPYTAPSPGQTKQTKDGARSPLGFPLEYPNRPSYN